MCVWLRPSVVGKCNLLDNSTAIYMQRMRLLAGTSKKYMGQLQLEPVFHMLSLLLELL